MQTFFADAPIKKMFFKKIVLSPLRVLFFWVGKIAHALQGSKTNDWLLTRFPEQLRPKKITKIINHLGRERYPDESVHTQLLPAPGPRKQGQDGSASDLHASG